MSVIAGRNSDFDDWNMPGWSAADLIPYLERYESYHAGPINPGSGHGSSGPISISFGGIQEETLIRDCIQAAHDEGFAAGENLDANDLHATNTFTRWPKFIHPTSGQRQDAAHQYLHSYTKPNLKILCNAPVRKVILSDGMAVGAEYHLNRSSPIFTVMAKKLVIISAGTYGTPQVLERSGIGNPAVLRAAGIPVSVPLPAVGEHLQDHDSLYPVYTTTPNISTFTSFVGGRTDRSVAEIDFVGSGSGMFSSNFSDVAGKVSPRTNWDYNEIGARNAEFFRSNPDKPAFMLVMVNTFLLDPRIAEPRPKNDENVITVELWTCYPRSKGSIHITSPNPQSAPMFNSGRLDNEDDVKMLAWAYKRADRLAMKTSCLIARVPGYHPRPAEKVEDYVRRRTGTAWHPVGTARMGSSRRGGAVVDAMLNVYGVEDLMVADLSICPSTVGANTCSVALMIGEKAAELAAKKLQVRLELEP